MTFVIRIFLPNTTTRTVSTPARSLVIYDYTVTICSGDVNTLPQFQQLNTFLIRDFVAFVSSSSSSPSDVERATVDRMLVCLPRFLCDSADGPAKHDCCVELSAAGSRFTRTWWCRDGKGESSGHREISDRDAVKPLITCVDKQSTSTHCE